MYIPDLCPSKCCLDQIWAITTAFEQFEVVFYNRAYSSEKKKNKNRKHENYICNIK